MDSALGDGARADQLIRGQATVAADHERMGQPLVSVGIGLGQLSEQR